MLIIAAILLVGVSLMHSILGGQRLINPICQLSEIPIILGSRRNTELTLKIGWHLLSVFWCHLAAMFVCIHLQIADFETVFVTSLGILFLVFGTLAFTLSRGRHRSWIFFLPLGSLLLLAALT